MDHPIYKQDAVVIQAFWFVLWLSPTLLLTFLYRLDYRFTMPQSFEGPALLYSLLICSTSISRAIEVITRRKRLYANSNRQVILLRYIKVRISKISPHTRIVSKILLNILLHTLLYNRLAHGDKKLLGVLFTSSGKQQASRRRRLL